MTDRLESITVKVTQGFPLSGVTTDDAYVEFRAKNITVADASMTLSALARFMSDHLPPHRKFPLHRSLRRRVRSRAGRTSPSRRPSATN